MGITRVSLTLWWVTLLLAGSWFGYSYLLAKFKIVRAPAFSLLALSPPRLSSKPPQVAGAKTDKKAATVLGATSQANTVIDCQKPTTPTYANSTHPIIRRTAEYASLCTATSPDRVMLFAPMPNTIAEAEDYGKDITYQLRDFESAGLSPLIVLEPGRAGEVDFAAFASGTKDQVLKQYFTFIKKGGITDMAMGMWVYMPETNTPAFGYIAPEHVAGTIRKWAEAQKGEFPSSLASAMLDNYSYDEQSQDWVGGKVVSVLPYLQGIPKGLLDSYGHQGFPWKSAANERPEALDDPASFLNAPYAIEAAQYLGVRSVWLNTGSFAAKYTNASNRRINISAQERKIVLDGIIKQADQISVAGFPVAVHVFAQDKSGVGEATDWSYWRDAPGGEHTDVFIDFVLRLRGNGHQFWLFDAPLD